ncbi:hypothetical protein GCM10009701_21800 [Mycolicibacterium murale]
MNGRRAHTAQEIDDTRRWTAMTALGAAIYGGFFALAALWLFLTADEGDQTQEQDLSNSDSFAAGSLVSSSMVSSHSGEK